MRRSSKPWFARATRSLTTICVAARSSCSTTSRSRRRWPGDLPATSSKAAGCSWRPDHARAGRRMSIRCQRRSGSQSIARAAMPLASARSNTVIRSSSRSARRAAETSPRSRCTAIAISRPRRDAQVLARFDAGTPAVLERHRRTRPRHALGLDARRVVERPADQAGVSAVHSSGRASSGGLYRTGAVAHGRAGSQCVRGCGARACGAACRADAVGTPPPARR